MPALPLHLLSKPQQKSFRGCLVHEFSNPQGSGGYSYSKDAVSWTTVSNVAYSLSLEFASSDLASPFNGTHVQVDRRERPELVFAAPSNSTHRYSEGPLYLLNGVQKKCEGVPACEAIYGKCTKGQEIGHCAQTVSVTIATALPQ